MLGRICGPGNDSAQLSVVVSSWWRCREQNAQYVLFLLVFSLWPQAQIFLGSLGSTSMFLSGALPVPLETNQATAWSDSPAEVARGSFHYGYVIYLVSLNLHTNPKRWVTIVTPI